MSNIIKRSLIFGCLVVVVIWSFTPTASTSNKQKSASRNIADGPPQVYRSPGTRHKVSVTDPNKVQELEKSGARVIADYGTYKLLEVPDSLLEKAGLEASQIVDENNLVLLNSGAIDTSTDAAQELRSDKTEIDGKQMHLIQFAGPIQPEWYNALVATGVKVVTYIPNNAYLVYGAPKEISAVRSLAGRRYVQWDHVYTSLHRLAPDIDAVAQGGGGNQLKQGAPATKGLSKEGNQLYAIQLIQDNEENATTLALIEQLKLEPVLRQGQVMHYINVVVALRVEDVKEQIAKRVDVVSIAPWFMPHKLDERQDLVMATGSAPVPTDYLAYLAGKGFSTTTTTFGVNLSDSGVDVGTTTPNHFALYALGNPSVVSNSRIVYARVVGTPTGVGSTTQACDGHGNLNAHVIGGYIPTGTVGGVNFGAAPHADASGFRYGLGVFPFVKLGSSVIFDNSGAAGGDFTNPNFTTLESSAYNDTMRISSNSWGASTNSYTIDSQEYDALVRDAQPASSGFPTAGNQEHVIIFSAGNDGSGANTVGTPGTAKNVITVGASENVQAFGGADGCGIGDTGADNANDMIGFSSRGPTSDGRHKPDIVAPGTHITGGVAQQSIVSPTGSGTGNDLACFNATGVCAGTGGSNFFPTGQQWYTASSGTSHSAPAISGFAALIRQFFINNALTVPSPAMTKALMLNTARYLTGTGANDNLFSNNQGMGEANFNNFFDLFMTGLIRRDQIAADKFTASGQQRIFTGTINNNAKPFRVTLAWTDPPGPTSGNAFINNLDLEVTVGGVTYKGNVFTGANSVTGGTADTRNNVESVFLPAGVSGSVVIKVKAINIAGNGVPGDADALDQDFALVVSNATTATIPVLEGGTPTITAESCAPADNAPEPGETITLDLPVTNIGTAATSNLVATLQATGGVTSPSGPQTYGAVAIAGTATRPFTFTVDASKLCGSSIDITLQLQDGATNLGTVTFTLRVGTLGAPSTALYATGNIAVPIPDNSSVEVPISVLTLGAVSDVNVRVRLNHTFDADLVIQLISPSGTTVTLAQNRDNATGGGDNYGTGANDCSGTPTIFDDAAATPISGGLPPFAGTFRPETPLSALNGEPINGTWKLRVTDTATLDTGTIGCVTLEITRQPFVCCGIAGTPIIASGGNATITAESVTPANNAPDPGETVTATFPVINVGDGATTNLVGTLQTTGGVTPVTATRTYGVVTPGGGPVSQPFTFVASGTCGNTITATIQFQDGAVNLGTVTYTFQLGTSSSSTATFSNNTAITIPGTGTGAATGAPALPYPSNITVSGVTNPVTKVTVTLKNMSHTFPDDVDVLLVGPTGRKFIILSDTSGTNDWVGDTITLDDTASNSLSDSSANPSGTYKPGNFGTVQDPFPAPAPAAPYLTPAPGGTDTFASAFNGVNPNGTWSLYVVDDAATDTGQFAGGWDLKITSTANVCNSQSCSISCPANITVPADVSGGTTAVVNYPPASVTGSCGVLNYSVPSGSAFPLGTTTVNVTGSGAASCSFTVTVTPNGGGGLSPLVISEFRLRGPSGQDDEYVELHNPSSSPVTVAVSDASTGWAVVASDGVTRFVIPTGTTIPAKGHYLGVNSNAYSLSGYAAGDTTFTTNIPDNAGIALFNTSVPVNFTLANRLDAVGSTSEANTLYKEGTGYPALSPLSVNYAFVRDNCGKQGSITSLGPCPSNGDVVDTNNNATDFYYVEPTGTTIGAGQRLGAPGPENLGSPLLRNSTIPSSLVFPCVAASASPNRVRDLTSDPGNNSSFGTLEIRRTFTNNTGAPITGLRFRIVDVTTLPASPGFADLRARTVADLLGVTNPCGGPAVSFVGMVLEQPPSQTMGGGFNSSLAVGSVTPTALDRGSVVMLSQGGTKNKRGSLRLPIGNTIHLDAPLPNGSTLNIRFLLGVQQTGTFKFFINVEALP